MHWCPANAITTVVPLHTHYHHPNIKPDQLNPKKNVRSSPKPVRETTEHPESDGLIVEKSDV
jgi:hypothetical protein